MLLELGTEQKNHKLDSLLSEFAEKVARLIEDTRRRTRPSWEDGMKKLINAVEDVVNESLAGFCAAHSDIVRIGEQAPFVQRRHPTLGKDALGSGGGSRHQPLHAGFVGHGLLDAAGPGDV